MRTRSNWRVLVALVAAWTIFIGGCTTGRSSPEIRDGVQPGMLGFVPARIAILPCQEWPATARFTDQPLSNTKAEEIAALCGGLDEAVLKAFSGQPFMRGYSPRFVERVLGEASKSDHLARLLPLWSRTPDSCNDCRDAARFYAAVIAPRPEWRLWLTDLSRAVRNADAVLLPFVSFAYERRYDDRGLVVVERAAGVTLLLLSDSGDLIWSGGRRAVAPVRKLAARGAGAGDLSPPPWQEVSDRLLTEDLWRDFPGRQTF